MGRPLQGSLGRLGESHPRVVIGDQRLAKGRAEMWACIIGRSVMNENEATSARRVPPHPCKACPLLEGTRMPTPACAGRGGSTVGGMVA